ncbi:MAG TPA: ATP-binding protein [Polyangiales bacterium]
MVEGKGWRAPEQDGALQRQVIEQLPDFVALVDREYRMVWVNRVMARVRPEQVIGAKIELFLTPEALPLARRAIDAAFATGASGSYEAEAMGENTSLAWYLVRFSPVRKNGAVESVLMISSDITERRRAERALREAEEQLHRAQRLESLGQLSGGIAHDFNNLLQVIDGNLTFMQERLRQGKALGDELEQALRATERAAELTSQLLAIGRRKRMDGKRLELGAVVSESMRMLRRAIPENIRVDYQPPSSPLYAELDAPQIEQVLINLCVNARDAMPHGGALRVHIEPDGDQHILLVVTDSGVGIPHEHLPRVFEPFFTTKGAGAGLGLAVAAGIVAAHGGVISADSDGSSFTRMSVRLPRAEACVTPMPSSVRPPRCSGVILVAEDETMVRTQLVRVLTHAGYTVLEADNGARAVELFRSQQVKIDLVLLDMIMPELDGWQAYLKIDAIAPGTRVLFSTGYAASVLPQDFAARGARLLSKPYKPHALLAQIRELMERPRERAQFEPRRDSERQGRRGEDESPT